MGRWQRQILDWLKVAVSQGLMFALLIGAARLSLVPSTSIAALVAAQAIGASLIGLLLRLRLIWLPVQLLL